MDYNLEHDPILRVTGFPLESLITMPSLLTEEITPRPELDPPLLMHEKSPLPEPEPEPEPEPFHDPPFPPLDPLPPET